MTVAEISDARRKKGPSARPEEPLLSPADIDDIRRRLNEHKSDRRLSETQLARKVSTTTGEAVSDSAVGNFLRNRYGAREDGIAAQFALYLQLEEQAARAIGSLPYVDTSISRQIKSACLTAIAMPGIAVIATAAGSGKTTVFTREMNGGCLAGAILIDCTEAENTKWAIARELAAMVTGTSKNGNSPTEARRRAVAKLQNSGRPIIVDECQYLDAERLDYLRRIHDQTGCPLIFAGNEAQFERSGGSDEGPAQHAQFVSRVVERVHFSREMLSKSDVMLVARQVVSRETLEAKQDNKTIADRLLTWGRAGGTLRTVANVLKRAGLIARALNGNEAIEPTPEQIMQAASLILRRGGAA